MIKYERIKERYGTRLLAWLTCVTLITTSGRVAAANCTAIANGDWASGSTWSCGRAPLSGDMLVIPAGMTVSVTTNIVYSGAATRVKIYGTLSFIGGGSKLTFPCGSTVELMTNTALITGNNSGNSQTIRICAVTVWDVGSMNNMTGYVAWPTGATLPVELLSYTATSANGEVQATWATASESYSAYYELRRGADAISTETIATLPAAGSSVVQLTYQYTDRPPNDGIWYYRLIQYDTDGTANELGTVAVQVDGGQGFQCFPVPATDHVDVVLPGVGARLTFLNADGREVLVQGLNTERARVDVTGLPNGPYIARAVLGDKVHVQRVLIAR